MSEVSYMVDAATLPQGSCPSTYQELADLLASIYSVTVNTNNTGIIVSATKPADTTLVWKQLDSSGNPVRDYVFVGGLWLSRHTLEPLSVIMWKGDISTIGTFDGGDGGALSLISGPMWKVATGMDARFPVAPGTLLSGTVLALGDTGGEEKHTLISNEVAKHQHVVWPADGGDNNAGKLWSHFDFGGGGPDTRLSAPIQPSIIYPTQTQLIAGNQSDGDAPHNNMPPYYTIHFIERTTRQYFVVP